MVVVRNHLLKQNNTNKGSKVLLCISVTGLSRLHHIFVVLKLWNFGSCTQYQPDYQHHKNRLLNIGMLAGNKIKTIVELDSNSIRIWLRRHSLFERRAVIRLFFCVFFSSIWRQISHLFSGFLYSFLKWMAMRWRSRRFWSLVLGGFVTQGTIVLDGCDRPQSRNSSSLLNRGNCLRRSGSASQWSKGSACKLKHQVK